LSLYDYVKPPSTIGFVGKYLKYLILRIIFQPLSFFSSVRRSIRWLDGKFTMRDLVTDYQQLLRKYQPEIVFSTSIVEDSEVALLRAAKREKIKTMAMPKSWDNASKRYFRAKADKIVVWSDFMMRQMKELQDYNEKEIIKVGVPQFDCYSNNKNILSRKEFCQKIGLDASKKIIFFGSEGKLMPSDSKVAKVLYDLISKQSFFGLSQLFIRPHFGYKDDQLKFVELFDKKNVVVDSFYEPSDGFRDQWDYSDQQMNHFVNSLYYADVVISTCSTLILDAVAMNKPAILINFDGYQTKPFYQSCKRWYICDYFDKIISFKAAPLVSNLDELKEAINNSLNDPDYLKEQRENLKTFFCHKVDGLAGQRLFNNLNFFVSN